MKKKVLFVASMFLATAMIAQDGLTSKKGEAYLPEAGDWALGFDGTPFLDYAGNWFNGTSNNSVNATWVGNQPAMTIYGKMFKDETTAYRAKIRIGFGSSSEKAFTDTIGNNGGNPATVVEIEDKMSTSGFNLTLGGGIEKRRGNTRIQGFYGGELLISFGSSSESYEYGDTHDDDNGVIFHDFGSNDLGGPTDRRVTEVSYGSTMTIGLRGFVGVEWFLAPKVSVSAEYGWGLRMQSQGDGTTTTEEWMPATLTATENSLVTKETTQGGTSSFGIDTDNNGGVISIFFHF
jgi:hypothetical protein